jgi:hypothetical protein
MNARHSAEAVSLVDSPRLMVLAAAHLYADYGWFVFPTSDKTPRVRWSEEATRDHVQIDRWWKRWPDAGVAIVTGSKSGVFVLDVDGENGEESLEALERKYGKLPDTREARSGRGRHLYFVPPAGSSIRNSQGTIGQGLDVRCDGGYIIAPPSYHAAKHKYYKWVAETALASLPPWLLTASANPAFRQSANSPISEGTRNSTLTSIAGKMRREGSTFADILKVLESVNAERCDKPLETAEVRRIAESISRYPPAAAVAPLPNRPEHSSSVQPLDVWPRPLRTVAYRGVFGELVSVIAPQTEADPAGILFQLLVMFGNIIGRTAHWRVEADAHFLNLNLVLVGATGKGRKGTSGGHAWRVMSQVDPEWAKTRRTSGLSSGEGLIWAVHDPVEKQEPIREHGKGGKVNDYQTVIEHPGVADKRLLVNESELSSALRVLNREGNTLSALIRQAWDGGDLRALTKNSPATATNPHISIVGQITRDELRRDLDRTETANGFGNRFLWVCVRRSQELPDGGIEVDIQPFVERLRSAADFARQVGEMRRDREAGDLWRQVYGRLSAGRPGLLGAMTARAEAQVMRLACLLTLGDLSANVRAQHVRAALEMWRYCYESASYIFGNRLGDPTADAILGALKTAAPSGLTRTDLLHQVFGRNKQSAEIARALDVLHQSRLARYEVDRSGGGRPAETWFASELYDVDDLYDVETEAFDTSR